MRVLKFGGTSLATPALLGRVASLVERAAAEGPTVVVASAVAGVTDLLAAAAAGRLGPRQLARELARRHGVFLNSGSGSWAQRWASREVYRRIEEVRALISTGSAEGALRERILATGERLSVPLVTKALRRRGLRAEPFDGAGLLVVKGTSEERGVDLPASRKQIRRALLDLPPGTLPVVTGFVGAAQDGVTRTLGRGGSDTSATVLGAALGAERVEIFTDVDGVHSANPKRVPGAAPLPRLSYSDAAIMARLGASVLHEACIPMVAEERIPVLVLNTFHPQAPGTWIGPYGEAPGPVAVSALPSEDAGGPSWVSIIGGGLGGLAGPAGGALARNGIPVWAREHGRRSLSFAVPPPAVEEAERLLHELCLPGSGDLRTATQGA